MYYQLQNRLQEISREIESLEKKLKKLPPGKICVSSNGKYTKWYDLTAEGRRYIPKNEKERAEKLALRKLYESRLAYLKKEARALKLYNNNSPGDEQFFYDTVLKNQGFIDLLGDITSPKQKYKAWANEPYRTNPYKINQKKHKSLSGHKLRSKSEKMIANSLFLCGIPFRVECELNLGNHIIYPDFTICRPRDWTLVYWEHYGMVDDPGYNDHNRGRHDEYIDNGIIPGINLIETYETSEYPLTEDIAMDSIKRFLL